MRENWGLSLKVTNEVKRRCFVMIKRALFHLVGVIYIHMIHIYNIINIIREVGRGEEKAGRWHPISPLPSPPLKPQCKVNGLFYSKQVNYPLSPHKGEIVGGGISLSYLTHTAVPFLSDFQMLENSQIQWGRIWVNYIWMKRWLLVPDHHQHISKFKGEIYFSLNTISNFVIGQPINQDNVTLKSFFVIEQ